MDDPATLATFKTIGTENRIGVATLTREKPLNSLTLETINLLLENLTAWLADDSIACIVLDTSTPRAFCAGADITALYRAIVDGDLGHPDAFFTNEYRLDHMLHQATKPILAWGNGVVMGGGLGLLSGCSHRVGTPDNRIAMPEITIGLFPDAGGTWLLSHLPDHLGIFAGLTGCQLSSGDALSLGILDYIIEHDAKAAIWEGLSHIEWGESEDENHHKLAALLEPHRTKQSLPENILRHRGTISSLVSDALAADDFFAAFHAGLDHLPEDEWLTGAVKTYRSGSPTTARIFMEQLKRAAGMSLAETFQMELAIACQCSRHPDFPEGVRALLVDKDRNPAWAFSSTAEVPDDYVFAHFEPAWEGAHPLQDISD